mmetsp:Transcript_94960/g.277663  ORF Transcript_94960/g.277663 Transcript_94960/m.277663 type:complete len:505 (-) Transcript_94960:118-1632(-)
MDKKPVRHSATEPALEHSPPSVVFKKSHSIAEGELEGWRAADPLVAAECALAEVVMINSHWSSHSVNSKLLRRASSIQLGQPGDGFEKLLPEDEEDEEDDAKAPTGFTRGQAIVTVFNCMVGASVLALPYAMDKAGVMGFGALAGVSCMMGFTAFLIGKNISIIAERPEGKAVPPSCHDWSLIGSTAFGAGGKNFLSALFLMDLSTCLITFLIASGINLPLLFVGRIGPVAATIGSGVLSFMLLYVPIRYFAYFSMLGIIAQIAMFAFLLITAASIVELDASGVGKDVKAGEVGALAGMLGCFIGCFNAHSTVPTIYQNVANKDHWGSIVLVSTGMAFLFYVIVGLVGYAVFGDNAAQAFTANLGRNAAGEVLPGLEALSLISGGLIATKMLVTVPAMSRPILAFVEARFRMGKLGTAATRAALIFVLTVLAVLGRDLLPYVTAIRGAVVQVFIAIVMPFAAYLSLKRAELGVLKKVAIAAAMVLAYSATVPGAVVDVRVILGA